MSKVRNEFSHSSPIIVDFNGKMLPDDTGKMIDRIAVIVSGINVDKLLGSPKISTVTVALMGETIVIIILLDLNYKT